MPDNMRSAIVLMLGGTGLEIGMMVRRLIVERYGSLTELPIVAFLHIDTAQEESLFTHPKVLGENIGLINQERVRLEMPAINDGGASYLAQHPMVTEWFPETLRIEHDFSLGAGAVRSYGRLAFSQNAQRIEQALHACAQQINSGQSRTYVTNTWAPVDTGIDVYVICSLLGGTGGGTFLDAAYLARRVVRQYDPNSQVLGFLVIGGGSSGDSPNLANCYSALKELTYYTTQTQLSKGSSASPFSVEYPGLAYRIESGAVPPFDFCYLASRFNDEQVQLEKKQLFELTAQNIFLEFTPGVATSKRAVRNNIAANNFHDLDQRLKQAQSFLAFGIATIEYPALAVQDCLAYRLAGEACFSWPFHTAPSDATIPQRAKADLDQWGFGSERLVNWLISDGAGKKILTVIVETKDQAGSQFQSYLAKPMRDELVTLVTNFITTARNDVNVTVDPSIRGAHIRQIETRGKEILARALSELRRVVAEKISNPYGGVRNTKAYLETLEHNLQSLAKTLEESSRMYGRKANTGNERITKTLDNLFSNKILAKESELRILVTDVLTAVAEHSHNRVLEQAYFQAQGLLVGTTTLTGALSDCLMKEISTLKMQILSYEERLVQFTLDFVGSRERNEAGQEVWTGGKYREACNNLTTGVFAHTSFVDGQELERLYGELARYPAEQFLGIKTEIELKLGNDQGPVSIFHCILERPDEVKRLVFELARKRFRAVQETSIAEKLETLPQSEVDRRIEEAFQRSHPLIRFDQNALFANDATTGTRLTHHNPRFHNIRKMATCRVQDDPLLVVSGVGENESKLAKAYRSKVTGTEPTQNLPDRYRIVFAQERGVFPLYCLSDLPEIRKAYVYEMRQEKARPRETNRKIVFPDLLPPDPRESGMPRRVKKALTLGKVFSLIQSGTDVQTEEPQVLYVYRDEQFTTHMTALGGTFEEALQKLVKRQLDKEIHAQRPDEETHLEHLEGTLKREGQKPTTVTQKAKNWELMQTYLINLAHEIPGGEQNPVFQEERDYINEFRIEHGWKPPANWAPPTGNAVPPSGTTAPSEVMTTPHGGSEDEAAYRRRIRFMLGKKQGGLPSPEETERWIRQGVEDFHLSPAQAQAILSNEQQPKTSPSTDKLKLERYREECRITMEGGFLSSEGREILDDVRRRLGLTNDEAIQIEKEIMPEEKYRQTCREVIVNRTIPDDGQEILEDSRKRFQLNFERAQAILQAVLEEPLFRN